MTTPLSVDQLAALVRLKFEYDRESGILSRKMAKGLKPVGTLNSEGYLVTKLSVKQYRVHRLAWLIVHGKWPEWEIDHINGLKTDNRWANLRDVPPSLNQHNKHKPQRNSSTSYRGVTRRGNRFAAALEADGRSIFAGLYDTPEEASAAYLATKAIYHPGYRA
jgi:hypothetical protein